MEYIQFLKMKSHRGSVFVISQVKELLKKYSIREDFYYHEGYRVDIRISPGPIIKDDIRGREYQNRLLKIELKKGDSPIETLETTFGKNQL